MKSSLTSSVTAYKLLFSCIALLSYFGLSSLFSQQSAEECVVALNPIGKEKASLIIVGHQAQSYNIRLEITGAYFPSNEINTLTSYYQSVAMEYFCSSQSFRQQFKNGSHVDLAIRLQDQFNYPLSNMHISLSDCESLGLKLGYVV